MGLFHRLLKGAEDHDGIGDHSPEEARSTAVLVEAIRALENEIRLLRDSLKDSRGRTPGENRPRRSGRGGRGGSGESSQEGGSFSHRGQRRGLPKAPPEDAPTGLLVEYLKSRDVVVYEGSEDFTSNEAFEHLARHIGHQFALVSPFYEKMKRIVATGKGQRVDVEGLNEAERSAAVQLGTLLHRHGLLKDFYYHRSPKKQLRVIPTSDGTIAQFLTGGWLEIYVARLLTSRLKAHMSEKRYQVLFNVKGTLPDDKEFEADVMALVDGKLLWIECKTGNWQDYQHLFRGRVKTFGCDRKSAALLLLRPPDPSTRSRTTDLLDMTLISLTEVEEFMDGFLGIESEPEPPVIPTTTSSSSRRDRPRRRRDSADGGGRPGRESRPAERPEAAEVSAEAGEASAGEASASEEEPRTRRRRRTRRGGRGRRGGGGGGGGRDAAAKAEGGDSKAAGRKAAAAEAAPAAKAQKQQGDNGSSPFHAASPFAASETAAGGGETSSAPARPPAPDSPADEAASGEDPGGSRRRRRRRRPDGSREEEARSGGGDSAEKAAPVEAKSAAKPRPAAEPAAKPEPGPKPERERAREKEAGTAEAKTERAKPRPSSGVTIAPDLSAMIAPKPSEKSKEG